MAKRKASAGPNPLTDPEGYAKWKQSEQFNNHYKRSSAKDRRTRHEVGVGWTNLPKKPQMRKLIDSATGLPFDMPVNDYQDFLGFVASSSELSEEYEKTGKLKNAATPADYIDFVFNKAKRKKIVQEGCGHIFLLEFVPYYQLLRVTFTKRGDVVVFFRVPSEVANILIALAQSKATGPGVDGKTRHMLGINFWNLIRVRGTVHATRYAFEYTQGGPTGGQGGQPQGGYYEVSTEPTARDLNRVISDMRVKSGSGLGDQSSEVSGATGGSTRASAASAYDRLIQAQKDVRQALKDGDFAHAQSILDNLGLEQMTDTTHAKYVRTGQFEAEDLTDKRELVDELLHEFKAGRSALLDPDGDYDYDDFSPITEMLTEYLDTPATRADAVLEQMQIRIKQMDERARRLNSSHKRTFNNLARQRLADEQEDSTIGIDLGGRSVSALLRQEQYLIRMGLWP